MSKRTIPVPAPALAIAAMLSVQLGSALSVGMIETIGAGGSAWLRLTIGAIVFLLIARTPPRDTHRRDVPALLGLGVATSVMSVAFLGAIERIPLGTAVAILAAAGWAVYILLMQHVGDRFSGVKSLSLTIHVAAVAAAASQRLQPLWDACATHGSLRVTATIAEQLGLAEGSSLPRPIRGLDDDARAQIADLIERLGLRD